MKHPFVLAIMAVIATVSTDATLAHEGHSHASSPQTQQKIIRLNTGQSRYHFVVQRQAAESNRPELAKPFDPFSDKVKVRSDRDFLFVESNGMPVHPIMIGIAAWQQ